MKGIIRKPYSKKAIGLFLAIYPLIEGISNQFFSIGTTLIGFAVAIVWIIETIRSRTITFSYKIIFILLFAVWNILSFYWSLDPQRTLERSLSLVLVIIVYWIIIDTSHNRNEFLKMLQMYGVGSFILALTALYNIIFDITYNNLLNRYSGIGYDPNNFGIYIVSAIPIFDLSVRKIKSPSPAISWIFFFFMSIIALSTGSRGALISSFLAAFYMLFSNISLKSGALKNLTTISIVSILGVGGWVAQNRLIPPEAINRASTQLAISGQDERTLIWKEAIEIWSDHWLLGIGSNATYSFSALSLQVHNTFLSALAELGIIGFIFWINIWIVHLVLLIKSYRKQPLTTLGLGCALACVLIGALTLNWEARKPLYIVLSLILSNTLVNRRVYFQKINDLKDLKS